MTVALNVYHRGGSAPRCCEELEVPEAGQVFRFYISGKEFYSLNCDLLTL